MSRRLLFLILLLVFLCLLCSGSTLLSRRPPARGQVNLQAPSLEGLRSRLTVKIKGSDLALRSGEGCAVQGERLLAPQGAACVFVIPASERSTRQLVLALRSPATSAALNLVQPKALSVDKTLAAGEGPYALDIYGNPDRPDARLTITGCQVPPPENEEEEQDAPRVCVLEIRP